MTRAETLAKTVAMANAWLVRELENAEILMLDLGATPKEIAAALGPGGWSRTMLERDRDTQIREVERWLAGNDETRH